MTREQLKKLEDTLWNSADILRSGTSLKSTEYSTPVLGLIFLKFADNKYSLVESEIEAEFKRLKGKRNERPIEEIALEKCGFYLPREARYEYLLHLPEKEDLAEAIKRAMQAIVDHKPELQDTLPLDEYFRLNRVTKDGATVIDNYCLVQLLKNFQNIPKDADGDIFG